MYGRLNTMRSVGILAVVGQESTPNLVRGKFRLNAGASGKIFRVRSGVPTSPE